jgi:excisionase family DNA binding protein
MKPRTKEPEPDSRIGNLGSEIMTIREVADYLKIHLGTVYRFIKTRGLPAFRVGSDFRFRRADVKEWIEQQHVRPGEGLPPKGARGRRKA